MKRSLRATAALAASMLGGSAFATVAHAGPVVTFLYTGGAVTYMVPTTGVYNILAYGGQGGASYGSTGGAGAAARGDFALTAGQTLRIMVGGAGANGGDYSGISGIGGGGGGGASFVVVPYDDYITSLVNPLVVAGGGGGAGSLSGGTGGTTANTGFGSGDGGNGGGGLYVPGPAVWNVDGTYVDLGGWALAMGGLAGGNGGFGGGGGGAEITGYDMFSFPNVTLYCSYGGGGGGYSGGHGGYSSYCYGPASDGSVAVGQGGTGGGSFLDGSVSNPELLAAVNSGNGMVTLALMSDIPEAGTLELFGIGLAGLAALCRRRNPVAMKST